MEFVTQLTLMESWVHMDSFLLGQ